MILDGSNFVNSTNDLNDEIISLKEVIIKNIQLKMLVSLLFSK